VIKHHADAGRQAIANRWCALATPVLKAAWTDQAFHGASACLQVFGGHGYVREWGVEQIVRDARVAMIYEGTNEIQAIDLLLRKTLPDGATALSDLLNELQAELQTQATSGPATQLALSAIERFADFVRSTLMPRLQAPDTPTDTAHWLADDFLRALALVLMAWAWARIEASGRGQDALPAGGLTGFQRWVWPEFDMRLATMTNTLAHR
jgi:hypothetical protein